MLLGKKNKKKNIYTCMCILPHPQTIDLLKTELPMPGEMNGECLSASKPLETWVADLVLDRGK